MRHSVERYSPKLSADFYSQKSLELSCSNCNFLNKYQVVLCELNMKILLGGRY
jgi:hypothetical protein